MILIIIIKSLKLKVLHQVYNLNFRNFIEIYEINLEKINYYFSNATYNFKFEDKKNISKLFFNENKYGFLFLIEYVYNIFYHLELDKIKYEEIVNCPWVKARNFIEIKNIIEIDFNYNTIKLRSPPNVW